MEYIDFAGQGYYLIMQIAAPMVGVKVAASVFTLIVIPITYRIWRSWQLLISGRRKERA